MKHATDYLTFETPHRRDYVNITEQVEAFVAASGIQDGLCLVNPMHITAAVYVNDAESGLIQDFDDWLERLAPHAPTEQYRHNNGEDNADAHLKRHLMSHQVVLPITEGKLDLGPWEQVFDLHAGVVPDRVTRTFPVSGGRSRTAFPLSSTRRFQGAPMRTQRRFRAKRRDL